MSLIGIAKLACNFAGILLLVRQGVPHGVLTDSLTLAHDHNERALWGNDRRRMLSFVGMTLFALATALQIISIVLGAG